MVQLPCPIDENGFINEKKVFQMVVGTLKLPISSLDDITPIEIGWLLESYTEERMEHYEFISNAVSFGYVNAKKKGKKLKMFKNRDKEKVGKITPEKKAEEMQYIKSIFANEGESD